MRRTRPRRQAALAILGLHKIGEPGPDGWDSWFYIPKSVFLDQLAVLRDEGWEVVGLDALRAGLAAPHTLPPRAALLTFDDGYRSMVEVALPCLERFGHPAVLFVPGDHVGGRSTFDPDEPEERLCDWDDLRRLQRAGVAVQSHAASHRTFSELSPAEQEEELRRSKATLEAGLATRVDVLAYPFGDDGGDTPALRAALRRAGYRAACLYGGSANPLPIADPFRLQRIAVGPDTDLRAELAAR